MSDLGTIRRAATASVMLEWAWDPYRTAQQHAFLFNVAPDPVTADNIRQMFGDKAAEAWMTIRKAKADFLRIVAQPTPLDEPGPVDPGREGGVALTDLMNFVRWARDAPSLHQVQQRAHKLLEKKDG